MIDTNLINLYESIGGKIELAYFFVEKNSLIQQLIILYDQLLRSADT